MELVQVGSLVHDDIIDAAPPGGAGHGQRRRGRRPRPDRRLHPGLAAELAAGVSGEAAGLLARALGELCEGQVLEMRDAFDPDRIESHLASVRGKTAALFVCASPAGGPLRRPRRAQRRGAVARFGDAFGMGFQVLDDVLDIVGDERRLGKPTGNDIASGVYTLPVLSALRTPDGDELRALLDPGGGGERVAAALDLVRRSGAVAGALTTADRYADDARRAVAHLNQTAVGDGLAAFPAPTPPGRSARSWTPGYLEVPLTAPG